jgi:DNA-binding CsgD family transcriptional regulator
MLAGTPLIGREPIIARVERQLDAGAGGIVLVGDGGIGKSRIAAEVMLLGSERGYATASTVGTHAAASIPLGALSHLVSTLTVAGGDLLVAARRALEERAAGRSLLLSVDDAHLLDNHSATLVLQLALSMPTFVVATIRAGEPVPDPVVALWKEGLAERVDVGPLDDRSIEAIAASVLGGQIDSAIAMTVVDRAGGNPLVARELCLAGRDSGAIEQLDGRWSLVGKLSPSARVTELVGARVEDLDDAERHGLDVLAHAEPLGLPIAQRLVGAATLVRLERRGLVVLREDGRRRELWLSHPFYADVVRASGGAMLTASIRGELAAAHAATMRREIDLVRVATWQLEAGTPDADLLLAAAHQTYRARDMAGTARLAAGAWDIRPDATAGYLLGTAIGFMGRQDEADAILSVASDLATNDEEYTRLALSHSSVLSAGLGMPDEAIDLLAKADARVTSEAARSSLRAQRAHLLAFHGHVDEALALTRPITDADRGPAIIVATMAALIAYRLNGEYDAAVRLAARVLPEHHRLWRDGLVVIPPELLQIAADGTRVARGELDAVRPLERAVDGRALPANRPIAMLRAYHAIVASLLRGLPREAATILDRARPQATDPLASSFHAMTTRIAAQTGDGHAARSALDLAEAAMRREHRALNPLVDQARIWTLVAQGRPSDARRVATIALDVAVDTHAWGTALELAHDLARIGGTARAAQAAEQVGELVDGPLASARHLHIDGLVRGNADRLEAASAAFEAIGAELFAAEAAADAGRAAARNDEARRSARLLRRAATLATRCEGSRTPALMMPSELTPLTPREREVASLAADGLSSDRIAQQLYLSVRTVDNHMQHVFQKLGIASRKDLSVALAPLDAAGDSQFEIE